MHAPFALLRRRRGAAISGPVRKGDCTRVGGVSWGAHDCGGSACDVLAVDLGGTKLAAAIGDAAGALHHVQTVPTNAFAGANEVIARGLALAQGVLAEGEAHGHVIHRLGLSTMGICMEHGTQLAPNVPGWDVVSVPTAFRAAFPRLSITVENDVRAATYAELRWGALVAADVGVYLNYGTGISAGLVIGGRVFSGAHGASGEVGYWLPGGWENTALARDGAAPTEARWGGRGLELRSQELLGRSLSLSQLLEVSESDERAMVLVSDVWNGVAIIAANLSIAIDPDVLVVGGGYLRTESSLFSHIEAVVSRAVPFPPRVVAAQYGADASLHGAVAISLDGEHEPRRPT